MWSLIFSIGLATMNGVGVTSLQIQFTTEKECIAGLSKLEKDADSKGVMMFGSCVFTGVKK